MSLSLAHADVIAVQPMRSPVAQIFYLASRYGPRKKELKQLELFTDGNLQDGLRSPLRSVGVDYNKDILEEHLLRRLCAGVSP